VANSDQISNQAVARSVDVCVVRHAGIRRKQQRPCAARIDLSSLARRSVSSVVDR
jgi:hypothetical protein